MLDQRHCKRIELLRMCAPQSQINDTRNSRVHAWTSTPTSTPIWIFMRCILLPLAVCHIRGERDTIGCTSLVCTSHPCCTCSNHRFYGQTLLILHNSLEYVGVLSLTVGIDGGYYYIFHCRYAWTAHQRVQYEIVLMCVTLFICWTMAAGVYLAYQCILFPDF